MRVEQRVVTSSEYISQTSSDAETLVGTKLASGVLLKNKENFLTRPYFVYAPPDFEDGPYPYRRPNPPYADAPPWKNSVYYYWWLYLQRNDDYRRTCEANGQGPCAALYCDFGDIYAADFRTWWDGHWQLFAEPPALAADPDAATAFEEPLTLCLDLRAKRSRLLDDLRELLTELQSEADQERVTSTAKYPVVTNPILSALYQHLYVWDIKQLNPTVSDAVLADLADVRVNHVVNGVTAEQAKIVGRDPVPIISEVRRRKMQAVQRHLRIAAQYIENVGRGLFPDREGR